MKPWETTIDRYLFVVDLRALFQWLFSR